MWQYVTISSAIGPYKLVSLAQKADSSLMTAYISEDGRTLRFGNESSSNWTESVVQTETDFNFFIGVDLIEYAANEPLILAAENKIAYLAAYTTQTLPSLFEGFAQSVAIRTAAIITWPTPTEGAIRQIIQSNSDLSNIEGWDDLQSHPIYHPQNGDAVETTVEIEGDRQFYRVVDVFE